MHTTSHRRLSILLLATSAAVGCKKDTKKEPAKPVVRDATYDVRVSNVIGLDKIVLTIDGRVVGRASEPHTYMKVDVQRGVMLSETPGHVKLHALSTCGVIDIPLNAPKLDAKDEARLRRGGRGTFVDLEVDAAYPLLRLYFDNPSAKEETVKVGKVDIKVPPRSHVKRLMYRGKCEDGLTVKSDHAQGTLEGNAAAAYVIDVLGSQCYQYQTMFYTPGGSRPPKRVALAKKMAHRLPSKWVDHFLEPPPRTLKKEVIIRDGKTVSGKPELTRHSVQRGPCR